MTATLTLPLVAWGTAANINGWTSAGTPVVTTGQTDPFGGTSAYLIEDNDAGVSEGKLTTTSVADTRIDLLVCAKAGTATNSAFQLRDNTAAAYKIQANLAWSGGVPTLTCNTGTAIGVVSLGNGWYAALATVAWTSGNSAQLEVYGASSSASSAGTTTWFVRPICLLPYLDNATSWPEPRTGSAWAEAPSGTEDAWIVGTNWHLAGDLRHIPDQATDHPEVISGWYGTHGLLGINCSVAAMLAEGRDKGTLRWAKDRATATTYVDGYLVEPMRGRPDLEPNWRRRMALELRSTSVFAGY